MIRPPLSALEKGVATRSPEELARFAVVLGTDRAAFDLLTREAWEKGDEETFLLAGMALRDAGVLHPKAAARMTELLLGGRWFDLAADVLSDPRHARPDVGHHWFLLARALAGLERLDEARAAVRRALALDPGLDRAAALAGVLDEVVELEGDLEQRRSWTAYRTLLDHYAALGLARRAQEAVRSLAAAEIPLAETERHELLAFCLGFVRHAPGAGGALLLGWLKPYAPRALRGLLSQAQDMIATRNPTSLAEPIAEGSTECLLRRLVAMVLADCGMIEPAIRELGRGSWCWKKDDHLRYDLARLVGERLLADVDLTFALADGRRKVFDLFPFNGEFDMLEIKLAEMGDWVDHFIVVESRLTFRGEQKPLHLPEGLQRLGGRASKVIPVAVDQFPDWICYPWSREFYQRDYAVTGGSGLFGRDDLVLASDVDEIVDRSAAERIGAGYARLALRTHRYFLDCRRVAGGRAEPAKVGAVLAKDLRHHGLSFIRNGLHQYRKRRIDDAGWHFTSMGDGERIAAKFSSYSHREHWSAAAEDFADELAEMRRGRLPEGWEQCGIQDLPRCIAQAPERYASWLL